MHKLLCIFGMHDYGELFHDDIKRSVTVEFPRYRVLEVTDERVYRKCSVCGNRKLIFEMDSELT